MESKSIISLDGGSDFFKDLGRRTTHDHEFNIYIVQVLTILPEVKPNMTMGATVVMNMSSHVWLKTADPRNTSAIQ